MDTMFCAGCGHKCQTDGSLQFCTECGSPLLQGSYGRFEVKRVVGVGPAGVVVMAHDTALGRYVALRVLTARVTDDAAEFERLSHSVQVMARQDHENWVRMFDLERSSPTPAVVMEYVDGASVSQIMDDNALDPRACAAGLAGAIEGVQFLHELGLTHGDLTPNNVLLDRAGVSKIGDVAIPIDLTPGSLALGYAAPEQLAGDEPTASADIYALGSLVYGMVTGHAPFPTGSLTESQEARHFGADMSAVPQFVAPIVAQCLEADPTLRPIDASQVAVQLNDAADREFGPAWRTAGMAGLAALVAGAAAALGAAAGGAAAGATAGAAAGVGSAAGSSTASTGIMATLAAKPIVVAAVAAGTVTVAGGGYVAVEAVAKKPTPVAAAPAPAGWTPDSTLANGTITPAVLPEQCYSREGKAPTLTLKNGKAKIPDTIYGSFGLIDTPLVGRFTSGGPQYTAFAFQCIGDGNYSFAEIAVLDSSDRPVTTSPATTGKAIYPLAEKYEPGRSISDNGPYKFAAEKNGVVLAGQWSAHGGGSFEARVTVTQPSATAPIRQVATPITPIPISPTIRQGESAYSPAEPGNIPENLIVQRSGDEIKYSLVGGGIQCFEGEIRGRQFVGTVRNFGNGGLAPQVSKLQVPFATTRDSLTFGGITYEGGEATDQGLSPSCG